MTTPDDIDLTPPVEELEQDTIKYLVENFNRIKEILVSTIASIPSLPTGVSGQFISADVPLFTITVTDGIVTAIVSIGTPGQWLFNDADQSGQYLTAGF